MQNVNQTVNQTAEYWGNYYKTKFKTCIHSKIEHECGICKWNVPQSEHNKKSNQKSNQKPRQLSNSTCPHWVPIANDCYVCQRDKERRENFYNQPTNSQKNCAFSNDVSTFQDYVNPDNINKSYPKTMNDGNQTQKEIFGKKLNNRTLNSRTANTFINRSMDTVNFINNNNNQNIWQNPIANTSFPNSFPNSFLNKNTSENDTYDSHMGITTRGKRKLDGSNVNDNLHLRRSLLQPDFRQGNRFYEDKPSNTRRESYRNMGNQNVRKFQSQTETMYKEMNYTKAYDNAAGINRG